MPRVIFDIETAGGDFDALHDSFKAWFLRFAGTDEEVAAAKESLSFYPLTGQIVAIGMLNPDTGRGAVYYQAPKEGPMLPFEEEGIRYESGTEKEIIEKFWQAIKSYGEFITFNGRCFDCPFILIRSALHKVKPTRELMPNRYGGPHIDLMDQLSFYGATRRFSLDLWCRAFGIKSPKEETKGHEVKELFREGKCLDIARYCAGDLRATKELFDLWQNFIRFLPGAQAAGTTECKKERGK
jgi:hypothetical protein